MKTSLKAVWAIFLLSMATAISSNAQTFTNLVSFNGANGNNPYNAPVVVGPNGNLYGTTIVGGTTGLGTVFEITPAGALTTIYNFCSQSNCSDGYTPFGGLTLGIDGNFYGTTNGGGANFAGTFFKITPAGSLTTLYSFCSQTNCSDGQSPQAGLVQGANGNFYGTTGYGGAYSSGTIFEITTSGTLTTLYNFCSQGNCTDGYTVYSALTRAYGKLYGVTLYGGASGFGTVFSITANGTFATVHSFSGKDGQTPWGGVVLGSDGNLYGTTSGGGRTNNGVVFKLTRGGRLTKIHDFCASAYCADGAEPLGTLIQGSNGNLYGTTISGGANYRGTVFEVTSAGVLTTLHSFAGPDGEDPYAGVVEDSSNGTLYGTTFEGGDLSCTTNGTGCGTVFSLVP